MIYYVIALVVLLIDQSSKWIITSNMKVGQSIELIPNFLYITSIRNTGAAWSILEGKMWFFYIVTAVVVVIIIYYLQKYGRYKPFLGITLSLIMGGTLGNFVDRLFRGEVVDFIHVYLGSYSYPIFNLADSSLVIGAILILIFTLVDQKKENANGH